MRQRPGAAGGMPSAASRLRLTALAPLLHGCACGTCGVKDLGSPMGECTAFVSEFEPIDVKGLADELVTTQTITALSLRDNGLESSAVTELLMAEAANPHLKSLHLRARNVDALDGANGARAIGLAVGACTGLTDLDLSGTLLGEKTSVALAEAIGEHPTLKTATLSGCGLGDEGALAMAAALRGNGALEKLVMEHHGFGDAGAIALADAVEANAGALRVLIIDDAGIGEGGAQALRRAASGRPTLALWTHEDEASRQNWAEWRESKGEL